MGGEIFLYFPYEKHSRRGPGGERKAPWSHPQVRNPLRDRKKQGRPFPLPFIRNLFFAPPLCCKGPKVSKGRSESPLVASAEAKSPKKRKKKVKLFSLPPTRNLFLVAPIRFNRWAPKGSRGRPESPLVASAEAKPPAKQKKESKLLSIALRKKPVSCGRFRPPAGGRGTFPHGKVPKGCRGRPKGACLMAAPGPPVAKLQCTASLAGARPARFTSVPGRATVAFGAADPSPGSSAPGYPWSVGKGPSRQGHLAAVRAPAPGPCKVRARLGIRLVAGPGPNQMACPIRTLSVETQGNVPFPVQGGSGGIPRPFEGGIGGPGGHRGEVGIPPAPLAGGATLQKENHFTKSSKPFFPPVAPPPRKNIPQNTKNHCTPKPLFHTQKGAGKSACSLHFT